MSDRRIIRLIFFLACGAIALGAVLAGCESKPAAPEFDNPFDPAGPDGGGPLNLRATASDTFILLMWDQPQGLGITTYDVDHSFTSGSGYEYVATVDATTAPSNQYLYPNPSPTRMHFFQVQAFNEGGDFTLLSYQVPASALSLPRIVVGNDSARKTVASRHQEVEITVNMQDSFVVAADEDFAGAVSFPVVIPGVAQTISWDFGPAAQNGDTVRIFAKGYTAGSASAVGSKTLTVDFEPDFSVAGKPASVATRLVDLTVDTEGVTAMRFATSAEALASAEWRDPAETVVGFQLADSAAPQTIFGEFQGDFGFNAVTDWDVSPDLLQDATFELDVPSGVTGASTVIGLSGAVATVMRFALSPDFRDAQWQAYADSAAIDLGVEEGEVTVYAQYRNDWADSRILTDSVIRVQQPVSVNFLAPRNGNVVLGGVPLLVQGSGNAGETPIDSVKVDLGDGAGFVAADGLEIWSYDWNVPLFSADTPRVLRARAWAGADSATAIIDVTVSQLLVAIADPLDGAEVQADTDVTIAGTASGVLGGAPLSFVDLAVGSESLVVEGLEIWSATWRTPAVTEATEVTILARAGTGDDVVQDTITVTVLPAE